MSTLVGFFISIFVCRDYCQSERPATGWNIFLKSHWIFVRIELTGFFKCLSAKLPQTFHSTSDNMNSIYLFSLRYVQN